ncbi:MAG: cytochrome c biogenesis protein CcsA [Acidimicrobiales bacterium]
MTSATAAAPVASGVREPAPAHTGSRGTRVLGMAAVVGVVSVVVLGLFATEPDIFQGERARLLYVHVPVATVMNLGFAVTALGSGMWLWKKSRWWDAVAVASAEVGVVFTALTLVNGSLWGKATWGTYWTWDARLTSTALLLLLYLGYLTVRRLPTDIEARNRRSAWIALLAFVDVPIVYYSVDWWRSLHQEATLAVNTQIEGLMLFTLMFGIVVALVVYAWLLVHRFRVAWLEDQLDEVGLDVAIEARRAEAVSP